MGLWFFDYLAPNIYNLLRNNLKDPNNISEFIKRSRKIIFDSMENWDYFSGSWERCFM